MRHSKPMTSPRPVYLLAPRSLGSTVIYHLSGSTGLLHLTSTTFVRCHPVFATVFWVSCCTSAFHPFGSTGLLLCPGSHWLHLGPSDQQCCPVSSALWLRLDLHLSWLRIGWLVGSCSTIPSMVISSSAGPVVVCSSNGSSAHSSSDSYMVPPLSSPAIDYSVLGP